MMHDFEGRTAEESESFVVVAISIDSRTTEIIPVFDQKCRCAAGCVAIPDPDSTFTAHPIDLDVIQGDMTQVPTIYLFVEGENQESVNAVVSERFWQSAGDISEAPGFGKGDGFRG
jgi:hypothetical protein